MENIVGGVGHEPAYNLCPKAPGYFSWGFVRNPYDRALSTYSGFQQHEGMVQTSYIRRDESFPDFLQRLPSCMKNPEFNATRPHFWHQTLFLCRSTGEVMVDFVGRFENLLSDWAHICQRIGIDVELEHLNRTEHEPWQEVYTPEMLAVINEVYECDFKTFGYEMIGSI